MLPVHILDQREGQGVARDRLGAARHQLGGHETGLTAALGAFKVERSSKWSEVLTAARCLWSGASFLRLCKNRLMIRNSSN